MRLCLNLAWHIVEKEKKEKASSGANHFQSMRNVGQIVERGAIVFGKNKAVVWDSVHPNGFCCSGVHCLVGSSSWWTQSNLFSF